MLGVVMGSIGLISRAHVPQQRTLLLMSAQSDERQLGSLSPWGQSMLATTIFFKVFELEKNLHKYLKVLTSRNTTKHRFESDFGALHEDFNNRNCITHVHY